jgi:two-component sensor histidine kinase
VLASALAPSPLRRGLALGVCLALAVPTGLVAGPRSALAVVTAPEEDPALAESRALYEEGKAKFDTFDFEGAVDLWTKAYAKLPESEASVRNAMVYNIATAQEKAYEVDKDVQHLRQAVLLLEQYVKTYKAMYKKTPETKAEVDKAEGRIATLKERIARAERGEDVTAPPPTDVPPTPGLQTNDGIVWSSGHNPPADPQLVLKNRKLAEEEEKQTRIRTLGLIHGQLYAQDNLGEVDVAAFVPELCAQLASVYGAGEERVRFRIALPPWRLDLGRAVPLALLITEIVTNALKYAFPGERTGTVAVELRNDDRERVLRIVDDGVGLPEGAAEPDRRSLGLRLMHALADQLDARLEVLNRDGVEVRITLAASPADDRHPALSAG